MMTQEEYRKRYVELHNELNKIYDERLKSSEVQPNDIIQDVETDQQYVVDELTINPYGDIRITYGYPYTKNTKASRKKSIHYRVEQIGNEFIKIGKWTN